MKAKVPYWIELMDPDTNHTFPWWRVVAGNGQVVLTSETYQGGVRSRNKSAERFSHFTAIPYKNFWVSKVRETKLKAKLKKVAKEVAKAARQYPDAVRSS